MNIIVDITYKKTLCLIENKLLVMCLLMMCVIIQDRCEIIMSERYGCYFVQVEELSKRDIVSEGKIDELLLDAFRDYIVYGIEAE